MSDVTNMKSRNNSVIQELLLFLHLRITVTYKSGLSSTAVPRFYDGTHYVCVTGSTSVVMCVKKKTGEPRTLVRLHTAFSVSQESFLCCKSWHVFSA